MPRGGSVGSGYGGGGRGAAEGIGRAASEGRGDAAREAIAARARAREAALRGAQPSRASVGGGYHGPSGAVSRGGYTAMGPDLGPAPGPAQSAMMGALGNTWMGKLANFMTPHDITDMSDPRNRSLPNQPMRGMVSGAGMGGDMGPVQAPVPAPAQMQEQAPADPYRSAVVMALLGQGDAEAPEWARGMMGRGWYRGPGVETGAGMTPYEAALRRGM